MWKQCGSGSNESESNESSGNENIHTISSSKQSDNNYLKISQNSKNISENRKLAKLKIQKQA
ncbi:MAG: hypothetical protein GY928_08585 [Colwellia sp.]|nr:hypothetical protein [Colwellia sp.]